MGRIAKIWLDSRDGYWKVYKNRKKIKLSKDKREAQRLFHEVMAKPEVRSDSVAMVLDDFLEWTNENRAAKTYRGYKDFCQSFLICWPRLTTGELRPFHVLEWLNDKGWNSTTKRGAITCLKRAFNWAMRFGYVQTNPLAGMEKPEAKARTSTVTPAEFDDLLKQVPDMPFKDLLIVSYDCGCRPQEIKALEARHVNLSKSLWQFSRDEGKGKRTRVVYIPTKRAMDIITRRMGEYPVGPIFRNNRGNPWTASAVKIRFKNLEEKVGRRFRHYDMRHAFITRSLVAGVDSHVVAKLAGHANTTMLDNTYSHVAQDYEFMLSMAQKSSPAESGAAED